MWYLKINTIVENQQIMNGYLSEIVSQNEKLLKKLHNQINKTEISETDKREYEKYMPK